MSCPSEPGYPNCCYQISLIIQTIQFFIISSSSSNPQAGGPPLVGCPRLLIQYIRSYPPYWSPFLYPQPDGTPCRGVKDPLITELCVETVGIAGWKQHLFWVKTWWQCLAGCEYFKARKVTNLKRANFGVWFNFNAFFTWNQYDVEVVSGILGVLAKFRQVTVDFVFNPCVGLSVRPSAWNNSGPKGRIFMTFCVFFENRSRKFNCF